MLSDPEDSTAAMAVQADAAALAAVGPFAQAAGPYADAGMATTPAKGKAAFLSGWQNGTPEASRTYVAQHGHLNVGVLAGVPSGVVFLDDDTGDPEVDQVIEEFWPSPWRRVGSKGSARAYAYSGLGTFRIKDKNGKMLVEHISTGAQLIAPPSIH